MARHDYPKRAVSAELHLHVVDDRPRQTTADEERQPAHPNPEQRLAEANK
jgi:hypothetical protein